MTSRGLRFGDTVYLFRERAVGRRQIAHRRHEGISALEEIGTILRRTLCQTIIQAGRCERRRIPGAATKIAVAAITAERRPALLRPVAVYRKFLAKEFLNCGERFLN